MPDRPFGLAASAARGRRAAPGRRAGGRRARHPAARRPPRAPGADALGAQQRPALAPARPLARADAAGQRALIERAPAAWGGAWRATSRQRGSGSPATSRAGCASSPRDRRTRGGDRRARRPSRAAPARIARHRPADGRQADRRDRGRRRFSSDAKLARAGGIAPIPVSSGKTNRHRLDRGGNRQINTAIHRVAVTRARCHPETRAYIERKRSKGTANRDATPSLKRHLARRVWLFAPTPRSPRHRHQPLDIGAAQGRVRR